jgi:hypothetical protein
MNFDFKFVEKPFGFTKISPDVRRHGTESNAILAANAKRYLLANQLVAKFLSTYFHRPLYRATFLLGHSNGCCFEADMWGSESFAEKVGTAEMPKLMIKCLLHDEFPTINSLNC